MQRSLMTLPLVAVLTASPSAGIESDETNVRATTGRPESRQSDLAALVATALKSNPLVRAAEQEVAARRHQIARATSLEDPMLRMVARPEPIQTAAGDMVFSLSISQKLPLPARLELSGKSAEADLREAVAALDAVRLDVIAEVERAYYRIYVADRSLEIISQTIELLTELEQVVASQYEVRRANQQDLLRVQTESDAQRITWRQAEGERESAVAAMNRVLARRAGEAVPKTAQVHPADIVDQIDLLIATALRDNPELAGAQHRIDRHRHDVELADLTGVPDLTLGVEWNHGDGRDAFRPPRNPQTGIRPPFNTASERGDDNWGISIGFNLPIWTHRNEAVRRQARARLRREIQARRNIEHVVAARIHDAVARLRTIRETIDMLETAIIPQARQTYEVSLPAFQGGTVDFLTVIDNWRTLLGFELMLHEQTARLAIARSDLARTVGGGLAANSSEEATP